MRREKRLVFGASERVVNSLDRKRAAEIADLLLGRVVAEQILPRPELAARIHRNRLMLEHLEVIPGEALMAAGHEEDAHHATAFERAPVTEFEELRIDLIQLLPLRLIARILRQRSRVGAGIAVGALIAPLLERDHQAGLAHEERGNDRRRLSGLFVDARLALDHVRLALEEDR